MQRGLRVPVAGVSGQDEGLPALSARQGEVAVAFRGETVAAEVLTVPLSGSTFEIDVDNEGDEPVKVYFFVVATVPVTEAAKAVLLASQGFKRRLLKDGYFNETRSVVPGDTLLVIADGVVSVSVHNHTGAI